MSKIIYWDNIIYGDNIAISRCVAPGDHILFRYYTDNKSYFIGPGCQARVTKEIFIKEYRKYKLQKKLKEAFFETE